MLDPNVNYSSMNKAIEIGNNLGMAAALEDNNQLRNDLFSDPVEMLKTAVRYSNKEYLNAHPSYKEYVKSYAQTVSSDVLTNINQVVKNMAEEFNAYTEALGKAQDEVKKDSIREEFRNKILAFHGSDNPYLLYSLAEISISQDDKIRDNLKAIQKKLGDLFSRINSI